MKRKLTKHQIKTDADYYIPIPNDLIGNEILNALNCETGSFVISLSFICVNFGHILYRIEQCIEGDVSF